MFKKDSQPVTEPLHTQTTIYFGASLQTSWIRSPIWMYILMLPRRD